MQTPRSVPETLAAAGIQMSKVGACRAERLGPAERELYVWVLRSFAGGGPPSREAVRAEAMRLGLDLDGTRRKLASEDLIHFDLQGEIVVAYPFSALPSRHRVLIGGQTVHAMCAIDALGVAPMFEQEIVINSCDPATDAEITVCLRPDGTGTWEPNEAIVLVGCGCAGAAFQGCCQVLNFFASPENAERYLLEHEDVHAVPITIPAAIELGRVVFGDVLRRTEAEACSLKGVLKTPS